MTLERDRYVVRIKECVKWKEGKEWGKEIEGIFRLEAKCQPTSLRLVEHRVKSLDHPVASTRSSVPLGVRRLRPCRLSPFDLFRNCRRK
jgi:hypothetical protein